MPRYVGTIVTPRPPEEVFDFMADFQTVERWDPSCKRGERVGGNPPGPGARFRLEFEIAGRDTVLEYETVAYERPTRLLLRAETGSFVSNDEITVSATAEGSALTYDADLTLKGARRLAEPIMAPLFKRYAQRGAEGLAAELGGRLA
jgi:carbon monoxide dehydrogenase subunit G